MLVICDLLDLAGEKQKAPLAGVSLNKLSPYTHHSSDHRSPSQLQTQFTDRLFSLHAILVIDIPLTLPFTLSSF